MATSHSMSVNVDLLTVKAAGVDDSPEEVREYGKAIVEARRANRCVRALCDKTDLAYRLGALDTFESVAFLAEHAPHVARVAIVCGSTSSRMRPSGRPSPSIVDTRCVRSRTPPPVRTGGGDASAEGSTLDLGVTA